MRGSGRDVVGAFAVALRSATAWTRRLALLVLNDNVQPDRVPMPPAVAARPRDDRGYPVPAITPWLDGRPTFAATSTSRTLICAVERRCSICGTALGDAPVCRVVAGPEAQAIADAATDGTRYQNRAPTAEAPGHLVCMLYAAIVCPYLARPNARRGVDVSIGGFVASRGAARGDVDGVGGAVVGFRSYEFELGDTVAFRFDGVTFVRPHLLGTEHLTELRDMLAATTHDPMPLDICPPYLLDDEDAADRRAATYR